MSTPTPRIFISHSSKDHHFCLQLVDDLQQVLEDESAVWYDARGGLHGGDSWWRKIVQELKSRTIFIIVLSPDAMTSDWVNDEIDIAWRQKNSPARMRIFPLLYRQCDVRTDLENLQIISFLSPKTYEAAFQELLLALEVSTDRRPSKATSQPAIAAQKTKGQWLEEGNTHSNAKQCREAIADFDRTIQLNPQFAEAYDDRGFAYHGLNQDQQAIADFDRAIQLNPQFANAYNNRGTAYHTMNQYQQAIADYDRAIQLNPQYAEAYFNRGLAYSNLKKYQQAIADYDRTIQLNPQLAQAYGSRGTAYHAMNQYQQAIADYDRAIQLNPNDNHAKYGREQARQRLPRR